MLENNKLMGPRALGRSWEGKDIKCNVSCTFVYNLYTIVHDLGRKDISIGPNRGLVGFVHKM